MMGHMLALEGMTSEALVAWLNSADRFLDARGEVITPPEARGALSGRAVGLLFFEPSTRTRVSFELAAKRLGGVTITLSEQGSSVVKGESVLDTCRNMAAMGLDGLVLRHARAEVIHEVAAQVQVAVINAGNGAAEHPSQGLLDALTLCRHFQEGWSLAGRTIAIVGDIVRSRVARSDVRVLEALGARVVMAGPELMLPGAHERGWGQAVRVDALDEALAMADAVIALRVQRERMVGLEIEPTRYAREWQLDASRLARAPRCRAVLHPGPVIRGMELSAEVADGPLSLILQQVRAGVAVRQALLAELVGARADDGC